MNKYLNWKIGGVLLGITFFMAIFLIKPIGVSTQFTVTSGIVENVLNEELIYENTENKTGYGSTNAYYDKSEGKLAKSIVEPINYSYVFVIAVILGGFISALTMSKTENKTEEKNNPKIFRETISGKQSIRYGVVFLGGAISLFGARLAGGCTSGHMMSGISQTSLSGMLFAAVVFAVAIPTALIMYRKRN